MDYHQDFSHVSKTMLNLFLRSRQEYYLTYVTREMPPKEPGRPAIFGQVLHAMALEDVGFDDIVMPYPANCLNRNGGLIGTSAAAFRDKYPDFVCMKHTECDDLLGSINSVLKHEKLAAVLAAATQKERRVDAVVYGQKCKCKPDVLSDQGQHVVLWDFKFSEQVDPMAWRRSCRRFRYWLQDAHYSAVVGAAYGKPVVFRFVLVETVFPYRVQWKWYDPHSREEAAESHHSTLEDLVHCHKTGDWSDRWDNETVLEPWEAGDSDLVEVEI